MILRLGHVKRDFGQGMLYRVAPVAGLAMALALTLSLGPAPAGPDVFVFKDPGCNLALGAGFTGFAIPGSWDLTPRLFGSYTPGLPFVFGLFASLFGCTAEMNTLFKYAVGALASVLFWLTVHQSLRPGALKLLLGFLVGLTGPFALVGHDGDRPEPLAFLLFATTCLAVARGGRHAITVGALLAGVAAIVHPFVGLLTAVLVWGAALSSALDADAPPASLLSVRSAATTLRIATLVLLPLLLAAIPYLLVDPTAFSRFIEHAIGLRSGLNVAVGFFSALDHAFSSSGINSRLLVSAYVAAVVLCAVGMEWKHWRRWTAAAFVGWLTVLLFVLGPVALFPAQNNYMKFCAVALPMILILSPRLLRIGDTPPWANTALVAVTVAFSVVGSSFEIIPRLGARQDYETAVRDAAQMARTLEPDREAIVVVDKPGVYFIYKPHFRRLVNADYLRPPFQHAPELKTYIACQMGRPLDSISPGPAMINRQGTLIMEAGAPFRPTLLGFVLTRSNWSQRCSAFRLV